MNISSFIYKVFNVLGCVVEDIYVELLDGGVKDNNFNELMRVFNVVFNFMLYFFVSFLVFFVEVSK